MLIEKTIELSIRTIVDRRMGDIVRDVKRSIFAQLKAPNGERKTRRAKKKRVIRCPVANCGKRGAGPKYNWACRKHASLPKRTLKAARRKLRGRARA